MSFASRVYETARDPLAAPLKWRASRDPGALAQRQAELAHRAGVDRAYLLLSFDCDTDDDARVTRDVHSRLTELGARPTYAVPGELLRQAPEVYGPLSAEGAEFLNHGGRKHTYFDDRLGRHASCLFYERLSPDAVREDILEGHRLVREVLGIEATGWRTPHFGTYGRQAQLRFVHDILRTLGYRFSSSSTPLVGLRWGPVVDRFGLPELPVTGVPEAPLRILDSWGFFAAPDRDRTPSDYLRQAETLARTVAAAGVGIINVYADPSHVHDRSEFFDAVSLWRDVAEPVSYGGLLERLGR